MGPSIKESRKEDKELNMSANDDPKMEQSAS
ncbi:hypothetical protein SAMN05414139_10771 [Burkholderia sp. D7]|nr:hypothetical protein SAMN05414139_10771 [Burkholderia sp. D7]